MNTYRKNKITKWEKEWYQMLSSDARSVFDWLYCKCDWGGFYDINIREMVFKINLPILKLEKALNECSKDLICHDGWIWITDFLIHQKLYPNILKSKKNNFYISIIELINDQFDRFPQTELILSGKIKEIIRDEGLIVLIEKKTMIKPKKDEPVKYHVFDFKNVDGKEIKYAKLPEEDWDKLVERTSLKFAKEKVRELDAWYRKKKKKVHDDDYLVICQWIAKAKKEKEEAQL